MIDGLIALRDVRAYLESQSDEYFDERKKARSEVLNDADLLWKLADEYLYCVNTLGCEPELSVKIVCDVEPGIRDEEPCDETRTFEVIIEGPVCKFKVTAYSEIDGSKLVPGDLYIARRNTGWQIGRCDHVVLNQRNKPSYVSVNMRKRIMYPYDCHECRKVKSVDIIPECGAVLREADGYVCPHRGNNATCNDTQLDTNRCMYAVLGFAEWDLRDLT